MNQQIIRIDGIKWHITSSQGIRTPTPLCPDHDLRMRPVPPRVYSSGGHHYGLSRNALKLKCAEGPHEVAIPRKFDEEKLYVIDRIDAKVFKEMKLVDLDGELTPIAKEKLKDDKYFLTGQIMESKRGLQVVLYAGEKGKPGKTQVFIEPGTKKVSFDHNDLNPTDVFTKIVATFDTGASHIIQKGAKK